MKLIIEKDKLSRLLYLSSSIVQKRNTMPVLANVKLSAEESHLSVTATDLEISFLGREQAKVESSGSITIDGKIFHDIVRELPENEICLQVVPGQRLEIVSGVSRFKMNGTSAEEFPDISGVDLEQPVKISSKTVLEMIEKSAFAMSSDETRFNLNGIFIDIRSNTSSNFKKMRFVATDGHRLSFIERPIEFPFISQGIIIPRKGVSELKRVIEESPDDHIEVGSNGGFFTVRTAGVTLGIRLVDGKYPDYMQIVPTYISGSCLVNKADLVSVVRRIALVSTDKPKTLKFRMTGGEIFISSSSAEYGEGAESISVDQDGDDVTIGFSARYMLDLLSVMQNLEKVRIKFSGEEGPAIFCDDKDEEFSCILMPMRFE